MMGKQGSMSEGIRIFIGLDVPVIAKEALENVQFDLMDMLPENAVTWSRPENMHVTLAFLGDGNQPERVGAVCELLDTIVEGKKQFHLRLGPLGCFPRRRNPTVIHTGLQGGVKQLGDMKVELDTALSEIGFELDKRKYTPHLTLGRVRKPDQVEKAQLPFGSETPPTQWDVSAVHLYHSYKNRQGQKYKKIHSVDLKPA